MLINSSVLFQGSCSVASHTGPSVPPPRKSLLKTRTVLKAINGLFAEKKNGLTKFRYGFECPGYLHRKII